MMKSDRVGGGALASEWLAIAHRLGGVEEEPTKIWKRNECYK